MNFRVATAFLFLSNSALVAQELRGSVRGTVTDSSGSVVAGASAMLRNVDTGVEVIKQTSDQGSYLFDFVSPASIRCAWSCKASNLSYRKTSASRLVPI
jgi:hypothetical protein